MTPAKRPREVAGLREALGQHSLKRGLLITHNQRTSTKQNTASKEKSAKPKMNTQPDRVAQTAASLAGNAEIEAEVQAAIEGSSMVSALLQLRVKKELTQEDVAKSMGCDPSKISRLESGDDRDLKWRDIKSIQTAASGINFTC